MNNEKLLTETLISVLSSEALNELVLLDDLIQKYPDQEIYSRLRKTISESEVLTSVFRFAKSHPKGKSGIIYSGYLDVKEVMEFFGVSQRTLAGWRKTGVLTCVIYSNTCCYHVNDLLNLLEKNYTGKIDSR